MTSRVCRGNHRCTGYQRGVRGWGRERAHQQPRQHAGQQRAGMRDTAKLHSAGSSCGTAAAAAQGEPRVPVYAGEDAKHSHPEYRQTLQTQESSSRSKQRQQEQQAAAPTLALAFSGSLSAARTMSAHRLAYLQTDESVTSVALRSCCLLVRKAEQAARGGGTAAARRRQRCSLEVGHARHAPVCVSIGACGMRAVQGAAAGGQGLAGGRRRRIARQGHSHALAAAEDDIDAAAGG